jgi:tetratricopeptide (TPR) repeat protein
MRSSLLPKRIIAALMFAALAMLAGTASAQDSGNAANAAKARALVDAAIKMTDSQEALKLLWQATDLDPSLDDPYVYLGLYYNSRSDFPNVVKVYQKLVKYQPNEVSAYLNIGEAYMQFSPPRPQDALVYYRKAYNLDSKNSFAALRIGEILAQQGSRDDAIKYLRQALADTKNSNVSAQAEKDLRQMNAL